MNPPVWPDEALFTDAAKHILQAGYPATQLLGNVSGFPTRSYWVPPLYEYALAVWINLWGSNIIAVRTFSFVLGVGSLILFYKLAKKLFHSNKLAALGTGLLLLDPSFLQAAKMGRMDMLTFLLILAAFYRYEGSAVWAGFFAGLAIIAHPMGIIAAASISLYMVMRKVVERKFFYAIGSVIVIWLVSMYPHLDLFVTQLRLQIMRKASVEQYLLQLLQGDGLWQMLVLTYVGIFCAFIYLFLKQKTRTHLFILIGLIISWSAVWWGREMWYLLYIQPFLALAIVAIVKQKNNVIGMILLGVLLIFTVQKFIQTQLQPAVDYTLLSQKVVRSIPSGSTVYLSSIPDMYFALQDKRYTLREFPPVPLSDREFYKTLDESQYAVINFSSDSRLLSYLSKHKATETSVEQDGVKIYIVKLR